MNVVHICFIHKQPLLSYKTNTLGTLNWCPECLTDLVFEDLVAAHKAKKGDKK